MIELLKDSEEISVLIVSRGTILFAFHPFISKCLCAVLKWQSEEEGDFVVVGRCCHCVFTARRSRLLCTQIMESQEAVTGAHTSCLKPAPPRRALTLHINWALFSWYFTAEIQFKSFNTV